MLFKSSRNYWSYQTYFLIYIKPNGKLLLDCKITVIRKPVAKLKKSKKPDLIIVKKKSQKAVAQQKAIDSISQINLRVESLCRARHKKW